MADKTADVYHEVYRCGSCLAIMSNNWDDNTATCLNNNCKMVLVNLKFEPIRLKILYNAKSSNNSETINR